jgi:hypothetical protein
MDHPEKLATYGAQDDEKQHKKHITSFHMSGQFSFTKYVYENKYISVVMSNTISV